SSLGLDAGSDTGGPAVPAVRPSALPTSLTVRPQRSGGPLPNIPGYEVLSELGHGGMGVVYQARQKALNRLVAVKMIRAGEQADAQLLARFRAEAEAVARLQHPNIVQIYEIGEWRAGDASPSMPFFSLEFIDGGSLDKRLGGAPVLPGEAA